MRFATYNVEWFDSLFDDESQLRRDAQWSARYQITRAEQADALGTVFRTLDADAVMIIEAPDASAKHNTVAALEAFAAFYDLRCRAAVMGFSNDTKQEIALLYDPDALSARHTPRSGNFELPRFDGTFTIDLDIDATKDEVTFSKPPLELTVDCKSGFSFQMIGAHLKSKAPHGAKSKRDIARIGIANRRKQLAQAIWLRGRIDEIIAEGHPLMVLGDLNDGPGLDEFEDLFGKSSIEIVLGADGAAGLFDPHADRALRHRLAAVPTTARFWIGPEKRYLQALLDYVMISEPLRNYRPVWRIWHPLDDPMCWKNAELREALVRASDHFPVSLDLDI